MGFYTFNGGRIGTGVIEGKDGVFGMKRAFVSYAGRSIVTTSSLTNIGVLPGGTSQSNISSYSTSISLPTTGFVSGKRLVVMLFGFRDANGSYANSRVPLTASASLGGTNLTIISEGQSDFNASCIAAGLVNLTGTQTFSVSLTGTISSGGAGYVAFIVLDDVTAWDYIGESGGTPASTSSLSIPGATGAPAEQGQDIRIVGLNASNPSSAPTFSSSDGFSYTNWFSQDNGTTEFSVGYYYLGSDINSTTIPISGTMSGANAGNGYGFATANLKVYK